MRYVGVELHTARRFHLFWSLFTFNNYIFNFITLLYRHLLFICLRSCYTIQWVGIIKQLNILKTEVIQALLCKYMYIITKNLPTTVY